MGTSPAALERAELCSTFEAVGPDAPTLSGSWTTRDLAAHLIVRERRPDGAAGILFAPLGDYGEKVRRQEAEKPWPELVERVRRGPPWWMPTRIPAIDRLVNSIEFFVHHEDVRRARPGWTARPADQLPAGLIAAMRVGLRRASPLLRHVDQGVRLRPTDDDGGAATGGDGDGDAGWIVRDRQPLVTVSGPTGELALFAFGRAVAEVDFEGDAEAIAALVASQRGL